MLAGVTVCCLAPGDCWAAGPVCSVLVMTIELPDIHPGGYLSTSCLHGLHDYCQADAVLEPGMVDARVKAPAKCKFCPAECICVCHNHVCPTGCDADCEIGCHELHQPVWKRTHAPDKCKGYRP